MKTVLLCLLFGILAAGCGDEVKEPVLVGPGHHIVLTKDTKTVRVVAVNGINEKSEVLGTVENKGVPTDIGLSFSVKTEFCGQFDFQYVGLKTLICDSCPYQKIATQYPKCSLFKNRPVYGSQWSIHK